MKVTVIGLERFPILRPPNSVECDSCGNTAVIPREGITELRKKGWTGPLNSLKTDPANLDRCPNCS